MDNYLCYIRSALFLASIVIFLATVEAESNDGICGGSNVTDVCGECVLPENRGQSADCAGECFGNTVYDECGICGGNKEAHMCDCPNEEDSRDCAGACDGGAKLNGCGVCTTDDSVDQVDCFGICFGNGVEDSCGVCGGDGLSCQDGFCSEDSVADCTGVCDGTLKKDSCGICGGMDSARDCVGDCFGSNTEDQCGICGGDSAACQGCTDSLACNYWTYATLDDGTCTYPTNSNLDCSGSCKTNIDCFGTCGGSAAIDECGVCNGFGASCAIPYCEDDLVDCWGKCDGGTVADACGICGGDSTICLGCMDSLACNYNPAATIASAVYAPCVFPDDEFHDCNGNCIAEFDCSGTCGGKFVLDDCQVCGLNSGSGASCCLWLDTEFERRRLDGNPSPLTHAYPSPGIHQSDEPASNGPAPHDHNPAPKQDWNAPSPAGGHNGPAPHHDVPAPATENDNTCEGSCGGISKGGCWCDSMCSNYGDCCSDIDIYCSGYSAPSPSPKKPEVPAPIHIPAPGDHNTSVPAFDHGPTPDHGPAPSISGGPGPHSHFGPAPHIQVPAPNHIYSCEGQCLSTKPIYGGCYCDNQCTQYNDCCEDYYDVCAPSCEGEFCPFDDVDCSGACGGTLMYDSCGVCNGDGSTCGDNAPYCVGIYDCYGICGGKSAADECGVCGGYGASCVSPQDIDSDGILNGEPYCYNKIRDCTGQCEGFTSVDACLVCGGDSSSCTGCMDTNACNFDEFAIIDSDECYYTIGSDTTCFGYCNSFFDCEGICDGTRMTDSCGVCGGFGASCRIPATSEFCQDGTVDCFGECNGINSIDACGVCGGDSASCAGCTDSTACNYNSGATIELSGACEYPNSDLTDHFFNCLEKCDTGFDCKGTCGGSSTYDICGLCDGNGGHVGCDGVCFSELDFDTCGVCDGDGLSCTDGYCDDGSIPDCLGVCGGSAEIDLCNICDGRNLLLDCNYVCFGSAVMDACGICQGDSSDCMGCLDSHACNYDETALVADNSTCTYAPNMYDCYGNCIPGIDCEGTCGGTNFTSVDCNEVCDGSAVTDSCGVCNGYGASCYDCEANDNCQFCTDGEIDCDGVCDGSTAKDSCDICGGNGATCAVDGFCSDGVVDCAGECDGSAIADSCDVCGGNGATCAVDGFCNDGVVDCAGECDGSAVEDSCEICGGDGSSCMQSSVCTNGEADCEGVCDGSTYNDSCDVCGGNGATCATDGFCIEGVVDCAGDCDGSAVADSCDICNGNGATCAVDGFCTDGVVDCTGDCDGSAVEDSCDVCEGDGSTCKYIGFCSGGVVDCDGICDGSTINDSCDVCGGNGATCAVDGFCSDGVVDCAGECDGSAIADSCDVCGGNGATCAVDGFCNDGVVDCAGECDGSAVEDSCEVCGGDGSSCTSIIFCEYGTIDCEGVCDGTAIEDSCDVCGGNGATCAVDGFCSNGVVDCAGDCDGSALLDSCDVCNGNGATCAVDGFCADGVVDCAGECDGSASEDSCEVCGGDGSTCMLSVFCNDGVIDCEGVCDGSSVEDSCGICGGNGATCAVGGFCSDGVVDCAGECDGSAVLDSCDLCGGNGATCAVDGFCSDGVVDCAGECDGSAVEDSCEVCGGDGSSCSGGYCSGGVVDCAGECNGSHIEDSCSICNGDGSSCQDGYCSGGVVDCLGICDGSAFVDSCDICAGNGATCAAGGFCSNGVVDCSGECDGTVVEDICGMCGGDGSTCFADFSCSSVPSCDSVAASGCACDKNCFLRGDCCNDAADYCDIDDINSPSPSPIALVTDYYSFIEWSLSGFWGFFVHMSESMQDSDYITNPVWDARATFVAIPTSNEFNEVVAEGTPFEKQISNIQTPFAQKKLLFSVRTPVIYVDNTWCNLLIWTDGYGDVDVIVRLEKSFIQAQDYYCDTISSYEGIECKFQVNSDWFDSDSHEVNVYVMIDGSDVVSETKVIQFGAVHALPSDILDDSAVWMDISSSPVLAGADFETTVRANTADATIGSFELATWVVELTLLSTNNTFLQNSMSISSIESQLYDISHTTQGNIVTLVGVQKSSITDTSLLSSVNYDDGALNLASISWTLSKNATSAGFEMFWIDDIVSTATNKIIDDHYGMFVFEGISSHQASVIVEAESFVGIQAVVDNGNEFVNSAVLGTEVESSTVQVRLISKCHALASTGICQEVSVLKELDSQGSLICQSLVIDILDATSSYDMTCTVSVSGDESFGGDVDIEIIYESSTGENYFSTVMFRVWYPLFVTVSVDDSELNKVVAADGTELNSPLYQSTKAIVTGKLGVGYSITTPRVDLTRLVGLTSTDESVLVINGDSVYGVSEGSASLTCNLCSIDIEYDSIFVSIDTVTASLNAIVMTSVSDFSVGDFVDRNAERQESEQESTKPFYKAESTAVFEQKFSAEGDTGYILTFLDYSDGNRFPLVDQTDIELVINEDRVDLSVTENSNPIELFVPLNGGSANGKFGTLAYTIDGVEIATTDINVTVELPEVDYIQLSASNSVIYPALDTMAKYPFNLPTFTVLTALVYFDDGSFIDFSTDERTIYSAESDVIAEDTKNHGTFYVTALKDNDDVVQTSITITVNCFGTTSSIGIATDIASDFDVQAQAFPNCQLSGCIPKDTVYSIQSSNGDYERLQLSTQIITALGYSYELSMDLVTSKYDTRDVSVFRNSRSLWVSFPTTTSAPTTTSGLGFIGIATTTPSGLGTTNAYPSPSPFDSACEEMEDYDECDFNGDLERFSFTFTEDSDDSTSIMITYREFLVELAIYKNTDLVVVPTALDIQSPSGKLSTPQTIVTYVTWSDETSFSTDEAFYEPQNYLDYAIDDSTIVSIDEDGVISPLVNSISQETVTVSVANKEATILDTTDVYVNFEANVGDVDIGSTSGFQFSAFDEVVIGSTVEVPVIFNAGSQPLAGFQIQIFFDSSIINAVSVENGADWSASVTSTLNSPSTMVQILSSAPESTITGNEIEIVVITFEVVGIGLTSLTGIILESLTSDGVHIGDDYRYIVAGEGIISVQGRRRLGNKQREKILSAPYTAHSQNLFRQRRLSNGCTSSDDATCLRGDANGDCAFSLSDLDFLIRYMTGAILDFEDDDYQLDMMDVDIDGDIDGVDITFMTYALAKKYLFLKDLPVVSIDGCSVSISMSFCTDTSELVLDSSSTLIMIEVGSVDSANVTVTSVQAGTFESSTSNGFLYIAAGPDEVSSADGTTFDISLEMGGNGESYDLGFVILAETLTDTGIGDDARKFPWRGSSYGYYGKSGFSFTPIISVEYGCECDSTCSSPGYFKSGCADGNPSCELCTANDVGLYPISNGGTEDACEFKLCPPGYRCDFPNVFEAVPCDAGTYQDLEGQTECVSCADGSYQPNAAQDLCISCSVDCDVGYFTSNCSGTQAGECAPCTPRLGYEFVGNGGWSDDCVAEVVPQNCPIGQYSTTDDFINYTCTDCDPIENGLYYSDQGGFSHVCPTEPCFVGCDIGFYNEGCGDTSSGECTQCAIPETGYYIVEDGNIDSACTVAKCPTSSCEIGQYLSGCDGIDAGTCADCTEPDDGYFTSNGGIEDACGQKACVDCPLGEYLSGCSGTSSGECLQCTSDEGYFIVESAGLRENVCEMDACADDCDIGYYRAGCQGTNEGVCEMCSSPPTGYVIIGNGGLDDNCEIASCFADCPIGEFNVDCGNMDNSAGTCEPCSDPPPGYYFVDNGGYSDTCTLGQCDVDRCTLGQFLSGCDGTNPGSCIGCTTLELGQYWASSGGLRDACEVQDCDATCDIGEYLSNCERATSPGQCVPCTNAPEGSIYTTDGGLANACEYLQCEPVCPAGEYLESCADDVNICAACTNIGSSVCMTNGGNRGKLFNYDPTSTNREIALQACESENGVGNCEYGVCGGYQYFYNFEDGHCDCNKAIGTVEWVFNNNFGYEFADQDYREQGGSEGATVNGDDLFTRIRTKDTCTESLSWEVLELHLGSASFEETISAVQDCGSFYYSDSGGFDDECPTKMCDNNCPVNQYNSGCEGTNGGTCVDCSPIPDNYYFYDDGDLVDACLSSECVDDCPVGYYLDECYIGPGFCVACTSPVTGFYLSSNGDQADSCTSAECTTSCTAGYYMRGECGGDDGTHNIECSECRSCGIEFNTANACDGTTFEDVTICEISPATEQERGFGNNFELSNASVILFGANNTAIGINLFVGGGAQNTIDSSNLDQVESSTIISGYGNSLIGGYTAIFGGYQNLGGYSESSVLVGGYKSKLGCEADEEQGYNAILAGGKNGLNEGRNGFVGSGMKNKITDAADESIVGGGQKNNCANDQSVALAGKNGKSVSNWCSVIGGYLSKANGRWATTLGGSRNTANGKKATAGGFQSRAASDRSFVMGFDSSKYCRSLGDSTINICVGDGFYINDLELYDLVAEANAGRRYLSSTNSLDGDIKLLTDTIQKHEKQIASRRAQLDQLKGYLSYISDKANG